MEKVSRGKRFTNVFTVTGDSLIRLPPKGYEPEQPLIDDLKRKDFIASVRLAQAEVTSPDSMRHFTDNVERSIPYMHFLCEAIGVPF